MLKIITKGETVMINNKSLDHVSYKENVNEITIYTIGGNVITIKSTNKEAPILLQEIENILSHQ